MDVSIIIRLAGLGIVSWGADLFLQSTGKANLTPLVNSAAAIIGMLWLLEGVQVLLGEVMALATRW